RYRRPRRYGYIAGPGPDPRTARLRDGAHLVNEGDRLREPLAVIGEHLVPETALVRLADGEPRRGGDEHGRRGRVEVPDVVVLELVTPDLLAGLQIERHDRVRPQVPPGPHTRVEVAARVAGRDVQPAGFRVDRR